MKRIITLSAAICFFTLWFVANLEAVSVQTDQTQWSAVMAGETLCDPVLHGEYLYTLSSDQALNCLNYNGSFVWRRNIERTVKPLLAVSDAGILLIADSAGMLQAVSGQGIYLWSLWLSEPVRYAPYSTTDGRVCILTQSSLYCLSIKGKIKWRLKLPAPPARQLCETGAASLLLTLTNKKLLEVSFTGELLNTHSLKKEIASLAAAPEGYVIGMQDGNLSYNRSNTDSSGTGTAPTEQHEQEAGKETAGTTKPEGTVIWRTQEEPPLFMKTTAGELLCIYAGGTVSARDILTNRIRWTAKLDHRISLPLYCIKTDGEYYLACKGFAAIIGEEGTVKRAQTIPPTAFLPLITPNGILIAAEDWVINSWRFDTKLVSGNTQQKAPLPQYRLLNRQEQKQTLPFFIPYGDIGALLLEIEAAILQGTSGTQEAAYAFTLYTILANNKKAAYFPYDFSVYERAQAAELLGRLESLEYRSILLDEAQRTSDPTLAVAIIRALGFIASDPDGKSIEAVQRLLRRCGIREQEPAVIACDTFAEIAKYGDKTTADSAVKALFAVAASPYPENIRQYARQKIKTIVE